MPNVKKRSATGAMGGKLFHGNYNQQDLHAASTAISIAQLH
ncbi:MAG: hypothetical protein PVG90_10140 [Bacillota bacterium]